MSNFKSNFVKKFTVLSQFLVAIPHGSLLKLDGARMKCAFRNRNKNLDYFYCEM